MLLLLILLPLVSSQLDYSQLFSFGNNYPLLARDPSQAAFYRNPGPYKPAARGVPINFNSVIHNVKTGANPNNVEFYTTTSATPAQAARPRRQRHWPRGFSYDAYEGGRSAYPGGYYPEDDGYEDAPYPPRRPRPRPRRPPPPRYRRPDEYEGYGRNPPGVESEGSRVSVSEGGGGGDLFAGGEGTKTDTVKIGAGGKGTISSDSGGLLSSLAKSLGGKGEGTKKDDKKDDGEGQKKDPAAKNGDEGVPLEDVKDTGQTRAPGYESATRKSKTGRKKGKAKSHRKKGKGGEDEEEEEEEDENGPLEEVDGDVKVAKTVDGDTYNSDEEEGRKSKRKSKKKKRGKNKHHEEDDEYEGRDDEDGTDESIAEFEDEDEEDGDCPTEVATSTTTETVPTECEEDLHGEGMARQRKEREKKKDKKKNNKKNSRNQKKGGNKKNCKTKKKRKCQNKQKHWDTKRETVNERHGRSEPESAENTTNGTELVTTESKGQGVDCANEKDEFPTKCGPWKAAGYCENNQATQYLWCRRTCLCPPRPKRAVSSSFPSLFN